MGQAKVLLSLLALLSIKPAAHESFRLSKKLLVPVSLADNSLCVRVEFTVV